MKPLNAIRVLSGLIAASMLAGCATGNLADQLYTPNFGRPMLIGGEDADARLLMNGLYAPKPFGVSPYAVSPYAPSCETAEYRCSQRSLSTWSSYDP